MLTVCPRAAVQARAGGGGGPASTGAERERIQNTGCRIQTVGGNASVLCRRAGRVPCPLRFTSTSTSTMQSKPHQTGRVKSGHPHFVALGSNASRAAVPSAGGKHLA
jgi:hypothetical protein